MAPGDINGVPTEGEEGQVVSKIGGVLGEDTMRWFRKRNGDTLQGALAFVPWVVQEAYFDGALHDKAIVIHKGRGAVVYMDASGFSKLTEHVTKKSNGAEMLSQCLTCFFTPLIELINDYHGDVIKFSSDALMVYFPDVDDTKSPKYNRIVPPHGTYGLPDLGPMATAVLRASACSIEIHKRLHEFDTGVDNVKLCLRIGVGCGPVNILQCGGVVPPETHVPRYEYIIAGTPLEQISIAHSLARDGETCLSPQAWEFVKDCVIEGSPLEDRPDFHLLLRMDESKYTFPTIKHAAKENDNRQEKQFTLTQLNIIRHFVPSAVFKQIECGTLTYVNEMRHICVIFIAGTGLDIMSEKGPTRAQELMASVQRACYAHEGTLNKFLIDDKGMQFLLVFGLPPLVHTDDPTRSVLACFDMVKVFRALDLVGRFGMTTSQSYCGVCGSARRREYTVLGDRVNLAKSLMTNAPKNGILCDEDTKDRVSGEIVMNALAPIRVAGKLEPTPIYQPVRKEPPARIGLALDGKVRFPWYDSPYGGGGGGQQQQVQQLCSVKAWMGIQQIEQILGSPFSPAVHDSEQFITRGSPAEQAPQGSPLNAGGVVVLSGPTGVGKVELAEHLVVYGALKFQVMPVFGTMGPRPGDSVRLANELLRSTISVFRFTQPSLPTDDFAVLQQVIPPNLSGHLPFMKTVLLYEESKEKNSDLLESTLDVAIGLIGILLKQTAMNIVLQLETGTSLFPKTLETDEKIFWKVADKLTQFARREKANKATKPVILTIITRDAQTDSDTIKFAEETKSFLHLEGLENEAINEYMSNYLSVPVQMIPGPLRSFIANVTTGNPLYIRETLDELQENQHVLINRRANGSVSGLEVKDLDKCNIAAWQHTRMVGGTVCLLESLDPLEAAVLKMSTCFSGPFALPDLAASRASKWADAVHFDFLRLYYALNQLRQKKCIDVVEAPDLDYVKTDPEKAHFGGPQYFQTRNLLIRAIAYSMVLEQQRKSVKRQALVDRALSKELPDKMAALNLKKNAQHIPWYYEQAFRRM